MWICKDLFDFEGKLQQADLKPRAVQWAVLVLRHVSVAKNLFYTSLNFIVKVRGFLVGPGEVGFASLTGVSPGT